MMRQGMPPAEYTYPKLVLCFFVLLNGSAVLMPVSLDEGFEVKRPVLGFFSLLSSTGAFDFI